jgi:hypothetical protein
MFAEKIFMRSPLTTRGESVPVVRLPSPRSAIARCQAFAGLVVSLVGLIPWSGAQTYVAQLTGMNGPTFVALDTRGTPAVTWLYVSEHGETNGTLGGRILRFNLTSGATTPQVVATAGTGDGQFVSPDAIVVDPASGDIFVTDRYLNRIQRLSVNPTTGAGTLVMKWGSGTSGAADEMHGPLGLARDNAGAIYVTEHGDTNGGGVVPNVVAKYTISGTTATRVWRRGNSFNIPYGIAVSGSNVLISDGFSERVQIWDLDGNPIGAFALAGIIPLGLSIDGAGALWIAESSGNGTGPIQRVERLTTAGASTGVSFGTPGSASGQFSLPFDAVLDASTNRVYVADYNNDRVQVFSLAAAPASAPVISSAATASGTVGTPFTFQIVASGSPTSYAATNLSGTGLAIDTTTGAITGTPTTAGTITSTVSATNATGTGNATLTITVATPGALPVISSATSASATVGTAFLYQITASGSPTSYSAIGLTDTGLAINTTTGAITGTPTTAGTITSTIGATNTTGTGTAKLTITVSPAATGVPTITSPSTASGTVGTAFTYQITSSGSPTSYGATGLTNTGLSINPTTGVITGTPTSAGTVASTISATGASGTGAASLTITISPVGGTTPLSQTITISPVSNATVGVPLTLSASSSAGLTPITFTVLTGNAVISGNVLTANEPGIVGIRASQAGGGNYLPGSADMNITVKANQTIAFNAPTSALTLNQPVALSATSSAGLPVTFSLVAGNATLSGNTLTPTGVGPITVRASQIGNDTYAAASADLNFGSAQKIVQTITFPALSDVSVTAEPITLAATSSSGLPITYVLVSGPATLSGNILTFTRAAGVVSVRAFQPGGDLYNAAAEVTRTFNVRAIGQQVFMGNIGADPFAVIISADNTKGIFVARFAATGEAIIARFNVKPDGSFTALGVGSLPASSGTVNSTVDAPATAAATQTRTITGTVTNGVVSGAIVELNRNFSANVAAVAGSTASLAGVYIASVPGSASGEIYLVAGPTGQAFAVAVTPLGGVSGTGAISPDGAFTITTAAGDSIVGNVDVNSGTITGTLKTSGVTAALVGLSEATVRSDRLVNLSSRLRVVSGDASRAVIAGFVVAGTESKPVLVRAVGPGLSGFGVSDALPNPRLQLFRGDTLVAENDDWSNSADVSTTGDRVGAFRLSASSRDSALVANLAPGAYTAIVTGTGGNGVALIEVYDAVTGTSIAAQDLVNISTRGFVDTGEGSLIAGFVVSGNAPKRVLIRAIGPSLAQFGVPGVIADPTLKLYATGSNAVVAQNDDWSTPQSLNASQIAATAADLTAAFTATGAFALPANSKDAAIVITLMPGQYSAVVSGTNGSTGAGLVEVYEIPNR